MNKTLISIVVNFACFFELADEKVLDSRTALQQLEELKWQLQKLSATEKAEVVSVITLLRDESPNGSERQKCLENLPLAIGLVEHDV